MTTTAFSSPQDRWSAISSRNPDAVGVFVYAVKTTGIYCRPDCKARLARQANIVFFESGPQAEEAGYRACKRCKPDLLASEEEDPLLAKIRHAVELVEETASRGQKISLHELSAQVGLSKWHLQRVFKKIQGLSPHELSIAIMNAVVGEAESKVQPAALASGSQTSPSDNERATSNPQDESSQTQQDQDVMDWTETESGTAEVDVVLRDLFPELYVETDE